MNHGLVPGGFSTETGRYAVFFTVVDPMDDEQGSREAFCDSAQARIAPYKKYLETSSKYSILVQVITGSRRGTAILPNKVQCSRTQRYTASKSHRESGIHENWRTAVPKRTRKTTCCSQSKLAMCITRSTKSRTKIIFGEHNVMCEASGRRDATSWTTESQEYLFQQCKGRMNKNDKQSPS